MNLDQGVVQVHIEDIIPNRSQPRLKFDEEGLKELADSIKEHGIIQPLVLRKFGDKYEIIAGERRYKAASMAGLQTVPAVISNIDDNKAAEVAIVENVQRRNLTAIEEARSYKNLLDKGYLTQEELAKKMGLSQPAIANKLRLLNLDEEVQQALLDEKISERHARTLLSIQDKELQKEWLHKIINERLTVRQLDIDLKNAHIISSNFEDEIPTVEPNASVDEIKANSVDIHDLDKKISPEELMRPTEIINEEIEELDVPNNNEITPIIDAPMSTTKEDNEVDINSDNKFFQYIPEEESTIVPLEQPPQDNPNNNNTLEIIDDFSTTSNEEENTNPFEIEEEKKEEKEIPINTEFSINANNKFFKPIKEKSENIIEENPVNKIDNPMDRVTTLEPDYAEKVREQQGTSLKDSIQVVRKSLEELSNRGVYAEVEEIDFEGYYEITIRIPKDDD